MTNCGRQVTLSDTSGAGGIGGHERDDPPVRHSGAGGTSALGRLYSGIGPSGRIVVFGALTALVFALVTYPGHWAKLQSGQYFDIDSMMRLVEVRDLLDGRGWFDPTQTRVGRPGGVEMHWSRLIDGPVAGLMALLGPFLGPAAAERVAFAVWPFALLFAFFCLQARIATRLAGPAALFPALVIAATADWSTHHFLIGNIDHHGTMIVLVLALLALAPALGTSRLAAAAAGGIVAVIPAVAIEGVPYAAAFLLWVVLCWIVVPGRIAATLSTFFGAIAAVAFVLFVLLVGPDRYMRTACDVYALPHAAVLMTGGIGMLGVARLAGRDRRAVVRLAATLPVAGMVVAALALTGPACFGGPYHMITPALQELWLDRIVDARSLIALFPGAPLLYSILLIAPLVALGATVRFTLRAGRQDRADWWLVLIMLTAGLATMFIQLRGLMFVAAIAVAPCAVLVCRLRPQPADGVGGRNGKPASPGIWSYAAWVGAWLGSMAILHYAFIPEHASAGPMQRAVAAPRGDGLKTIIDTDCMRAASHTELAGMAPAQVVAMPGLGVPVLLHTRHRIAAATFHRFGDDIVDMLRLFTEADPNIAADGYAGALLAACLTSRESRVYAAAAPDGLISRLMAGDPPAWLEPVSTRRDTALRIYRIAR